MMFGYGGNVRAEPVGRGNTRVVLPPVIEPLDTQQAIAHLRENDDVDLVDLNAKIREARGFVEDYIGRALAPQLLEWATTSFPGGGSTTLGSASRWCTANMIGAWMELELPMPPAISIAAISYINSDGVDAVMDPTTYRLDIHAQPAVIYLPSGGTWPSVLSGRNAVRVLYYAGYDATGNSPDNNPMPPAIMAAMKLVLGHLWEHREAVTEGRTATLAEVPIGILELLAPYRTRLPMA